jgi:TRAP-type C4-dicarboxylate transport system substrate-binding protein
MHFFNNKRPINSISDFSGLKVRVAGGVMQDVAKSIGTTPILQPAGSVYELMSGGVIDGFIFPLETIKSFNLEKVKHATIIPGGLTAVPIFVAMNPKKFASLSKEDQAILMRNSGERLSRINGPVWDERDKVGLDGIKQAGGTVATANPELTKRIFDATKPAVDGWLKEVKEKANVDGNTVLATFRAEAKKAEAK